MGSVQPHDRPGSRQCASCGALVAEPRCEGCGAAVHAGGYEIDMVLATGARGRVYVARDNSDRRVVLKELAFATVPGQEQLNAFEREAAVLMQLNHPRIPKFLGAFEEGAGAHLRLYLVQEYIAGETLLQRISKRAFDESEARGIAQEILQIIEYLHASERRLLHRDIKPSNLIVDRQGKLWLVDFGSVRQLAGDATHHATLTGTFGYMPVEQMGGTVDDTSDLYAVGATLIHLLSGRHPSTMLGPDLELAFRPYVHASPAMTAFLTRLVSLEKGRRYGTATEALRHLLSPPPPARTRRRIPVVAMGATLFLVGGRVLLWWKPSLLNGLAAVSTLVAPGVGATPRGPAHIARQLLIAGPFATEGGQQYDTGLLNMIDVEPMGVVAFGSENAEALRVTLRFTLGEHLSRPDLPAAPQFVLRDVADRRYAEVGTAKTEKNEQGGLEMRRVFHVRAEIDRVNLFIGSGQQVRAVAGLSLTDSEARR